MISDFQCPLVSNSRNITAEKRNFLGKTFLFVYYTEVEDNLRRTTEVDANGLTSMCSEPDIKFVYDFYKVDPLSFTATNLTGTSDQPA